MTCFDKKEKASMFQVWFIRTQWFRLIDLFRGQRQMHSPCFARDFTYCVAFTPTYYLNIRIIINSSSVNISYIHADVPCSEKMFNV